MKLNASFQTSEFHLVPTGLSEDFLRTLEGAALASLEERKDLATDPWERLTQWVEDPNLSAVLCGEEVTSRLQQRFGRKLAVHPNGLPKISASVAPWQGLSLHTDFDPACRELTCCLWLTSMLPDQGGTLLLADSPTKQCQRIAPERGMMLAFVPSPTTWHSVTPLIYGTRISILYSFLLTEEP